ncbi:hypothetical protein DENIS_0550 [Desulfonema ishimotonii]|uniref:D-alanyl-D-alanine carboxypeptidase n=1 Tax=Desulfonema ishimotonii TaxID=45657 RepID=A0A401FRM3_9BACT|nr:D-alanyl-D-alanine carboxypeptidase [Desulfonema ishimotonii]GBC59611.1 hypothetical protein DENIS_0550 [Desulfonema ishimotonii]
MQRYRNHTRTLLILLWAVILCSTAGTLQAQDWTPVGNRVGENDAVLIADPEGRVVYSKNADKQLIPASTLKIFTSLLARHTLGPDYRFRTEFYADASGNLTIKGYGDPLLISEVMAEMARTLRGQIGTVHDIILDDTYFTSIRIPGVTTSLNPYDAPSGALCVNFNTICFQRVSGRYASAEPQTPLIPFALDRIRKTGLSRGRVVLSARDHEASLYAGHLFRHFFRQAGIRVTGDIRRGAVRAESDRLILRHTSAFSLDQVISRLLEYSNNFIANQLFVASGIAAYGPPGTLEKGLRAASDFVAGDTLKLSAHTIAEGSGISRKNRISARTMLALLEAFAPHCTLMRHQGREYYKTGSLSGVKTRAGYIQSRGGGFYRFVVMVNTPGKRTDRIMKQILRGTD